MLPSQTTFSPRSNSEATSCRHLDPTASGVCSSPALLSSGARHATSGTRSGACSLDASSSFGSSGIFGNGLSRFGNRFGISSSFGRVGSFGRFGSFSTLNGATSPEEEACSGSATWCDGEADYLAMWRARMDELRELGWREADWTLHPAEGREEEEEGEGRAALDPLLLLYIQLNVAPLRRIYSWAVPTGEAIDAIVKSAPGGVLEIGAGTGYWAHLLRQRGVQVAAYDLQPLDGDNPGTNGHHSLPAGMIFQEDAAAAAPAVDACHLAHPPPFTHVGTGVNVVGKLSQNTLQTLFEKHVADKALDTT
eukprot:jgi/Mesen1/8472/ME000478S07970